MTTNHKTCDYEEVNCDDKNPDSSEEQTLTRSNFIRQLLVSSTIWTLYFICGLHLGTPTVMIPQLRKDANSSTLSEDDLGSWLTSMFSIGAVPWTIILPVIINSIGRKKTFILIFLVGFLGGLVIVNYQNLTHILIGQLISGIMLGSNNSISVFIITEYTSPKYRGLFMTIKSASVLWGIWVANIIGTFWHWKKIFLLVFLCNAYTLTVFAWSESPYWLAKEKHFDDCIKAYKELNGTSERAKQDLNLLIKSYEKNENKECDSICSWSFLRSYLRLLLCKAYYKPLLLSILLAVQYHLMGKLICTMYAIQILKKITQNESIAYKGMLILDGVTVFSAYCGCIASRFCKRRHVLFTTSFLSIIFLYILSLYLFLNNRSIIIENNIISISLLAFYSVSVCSGPMILLTSIYGELISFRHQQSSAIIFGIIYSIVLAVSLKTSLFIFKELTISGAFLFFGIVSTIITFILYVTLPETKNKSRHEIENYFNNGLVDRENTEDIETAT